MFAANLRGLRRLCLTFFVLIATARAEPIHVKYRQGSAHGFASLKTLEGKMIAVGEATQTVRGDRVTSRFVFRFRDGSIDDEQTVFEQRQVFRLISNHHVQHGPSFPHSIDLFIDAATGNLTSRAEDGTVSHEHMDLPPDISNGLPPNLLLNISPTTPETRISYVAPGTKPRLVHLLIKPTGIVPFTVGPMRRKATDYTVHVEIGGIAGFVAPLMGKEPTDYHIFIASGTPPAFIREEGALYLGGPVWRIEQLSPSSAP